MLTGRDRRRSLAVVGIAFVVAACGGSASTQPPSSAQPSASTTAVASTAPSTAATPSPSSGVADAFLAKAKAGVVGEGTTTGTMTVGTVQGTIAGTFQINGSDSVETTVISIGGRTNETGQIVKGGAVFRKDGAKPWMRAGVGGKSTASLFQNLVAMKDSGVQTVGSASLHRIDFATPPALAKEDFGLVGDAYASFVAGAHFWASDDGTPMGIGYEASWQQTVGSTVTPVSMKVETVFAKAGGITIDAPQAWAYYDGSTQFTVAAPEWFTADETDAKDGLWFWYDGSSRWLELTREAYTTQRTFAAYLTNVRGWLKTERKVGKLLTDKATTLAGLPARVLEYEYVEKSLDNAKLHVREVYVLKGKTMWILAVYGTPEGAAKDGEMLEQAAATFALK